MNDQVITLYKVEDIVAFLQENASQEVLDKFVGIVSPVMKKYAGDDGAYVSRLTNDPATVNSALSSMPRVQISHSLPLPKGVYFFNLLQVQGKKAGEVIQRDVPHKAMAVLFVVIDLEKQIIEDQTHNLKD